MLLENITHVETNCFPCPCCQLDQLCWSRSQIGLCTYTYNEKHFMIHKHAYRHNMLTWHKNCMKGHPKQARCSVQRRIKHAVQMFSLYHKGICNTNSNLRQHVDNVSTAYVTFSNNSHVCRPYYLNSLM